MRKLLNGYMVKLLRDSGQDRVISSKDGMAIIEIMIGFLMISFLLTGLAVAGMYAIRNAQFAREKSTATKLASAQIERFRVRRDSQGFSALNAPVCNPCYISNSLDYESVVPTPHIEYGIYNISSRVNTSLECPTPAPPLSGNVYKISTTVTWGSPIHTVGNNSCLSDWQ